MKINHASLMIGGAAGQGVKSAGLLLGRTLSRVGLNLFLNNEYPSLIRGGHNSIQLMAAEKPVRSHTRSLDILLALDKLTIDVHKAEIRPGGAVIFDGEAIELQPSDLGRDDILALDIPFGKIIKESGGSKKMLNTMGVGAMLGLMSFDFEKFSSIIGDTFSKLSDEKVEKNVELAGKAFRQAKEEFAEKFDIRIEGREAPRRMFINGNEAAGMGAVKADVRFYSGYPMTPSSSLLAYLAKHGRDYDIVVEHPEDELSAIGMALGASFSGVRAMTGTSGGGFCLMTEHLGLAGMAEIPIVIVESQRPGPATGLATRTDQGDLKFVLSAAQGEFERVVVAPGDVEEAFRWTFEAFNLADRFHTPVIVLLDKHLSESSWTQEFFNTEGMKIDRGEWAAPESIVEGETFKRYKWTDSGVSPMTRPGIPGVRVIATGNEHDEEGIVTEDEEIRLKMTEKRLKKLSALDVEETGWDLHGPGEADLTVVGWGSTKGVILDVLDELNAGGARVNFLQVRFMNPFPAGRVAEVLGRAKKTVLVEMTATGQLAALIREKTGLLIEDRILKYTGRQFMTDELAGLLRKRL